MNDAGPLVAPDLTDQDFIAKADRLIGALRATLAGLGSPAAGLIPQALGPPSAAKPVVLPVLADLDTLVAHAPATTAPAVQALRAIADRLAWRQTYARPAVSEAFLLNYGWTELIGPTAVFRAPDVSIGILILGPNTIYPKHSHEALERYAPLSGQAEWFNEDDGWRRVQPPQVIVHRPWVKHAMQTRTEPLLAFYQWSGPGVGGSSRLS